MDSQRIGSMVVVDGDGAPVGVFTLHDVLSFRQLDHLGDAVLTTPLIERLRAAYPGAFWIPAPTMETLATEASVVMSAKPSSRMSGSSSFRVRSSAGRGKRAVEVFHILIRRRSPPTLSRWGGHAPDQYFRTAARNFRQAPVSGASNTWAAVPMDDAVPDSKSSFVRTPNFEKLAQTGMRFANFYAPSPRCTPSRAALLTGKSPARLHMTFVGEGKKETGAMAALPIWMDFMKVAIAGHDKEDFLPPPADMNVKAAKVDTPDYRPGSGEEH